MRVYVSHRITSPDRSTAEFRCQKAAEFAKRLRREWDALSNVILGSRPTLDVYVPGGATETFVARAYAKKMLTVDQILEIDCDIIDACDVMVLFDPEYGLKGFESLSNGCQVEVDHCRKTKTPVFFEHSASDQAVLRTVHFLLGIAAAKGLLICH